jgi:hypothetical protein
MRTMVACVVPKRALLALRRLCNHGWRAEVFIPALLDALHGLIPSARNLFDWADAEGRLLHYFVEGEVNTAVARLYFDRFHNREEAASMPAFDSLRHAPMGVRGAADLNTAEFFRSDLYQQIWIPQGLHTRIEGIVRNRSGRLVGSLVLYRGPCDTPFNEHDEALLALLLPMVAGALERAQRTAAVTPRELHVSSREPVQTLLLDLHGQVLHATPGAARLLMLADDGLCRDALQRTMDGRVQRLFARLITQLSQRAQQQPALPPKAGWPSLTVLNAFGRFDVHSAILCPPDAPAAIGAPLLQLMLRWLEPREVTLQRVLRELPISEGQASVCAALYAGQAQTDIARSKGVAASTVVDHVRKLYRTLEVSASTELRELIDRRITAQV